MARRGLRLNLSRRHALALFAAAFVVSPRARAFGDAGAFNPRVLKAGGSGLDATRLTAPSRWSWELVRRTSAPAKLQTSEVGADQPALLADPFVIWAGANEVTALSAPEIRGLERFLKLGDGVLYAFAAVLGLGCRFLDSPALRVRQLLDAIEQFGELGLKCLLIHVFGSPPMEPPHVEVRRLFWTLSRRGHSVLRERPTRHAPDGARRFLGKTGVREYGYEKCC